MKNKDRLYIALYARGGAPKMPGKEDTYHWALHIHPKPKSPSNSPKITPQPEPGTCYNAKETLSPIGVPQWHSQETASPPGPRHAAILLVRAMVAKVNNTPRLQELLRKVPIRQGMQGWDCVGWVKEALEVSRDGEVLGKNVVDWESVVEGVMGYVERKREEGRFRGREVFDRGFRRLIWWGVLRL